MNKRVSGRFGRRTCWVKGVCVCLKAVAYVVAEGAAEEVRRRAHQNDHQDHERRLIDGVRDLVRELAEGARDDPRDDGDEELHGEVEDDELVHRRQVRRLGQGCSRGTHEGRDHGVRTGCLVSSHCALVCYCSRGCGLRGGRRGGAFGAFGAYWRR